MKLINNRGRVLLEVYGAIAHPGRGTLYEYRGDGCGGLVDKKGLNMAITALKAEAPSVRTEGELPQPRQLPGFWSRMAEP